MEGAVEETVTPKEDATIEVEAIVAMKEDRALEVEVATMIAEVAIMATEAITIIGVVMVAAVAEETPEAEGVTGAVGIEVTEVEVTEVEVTLVIDLKHLEWNQEILFRYLPITSV